ncbi:MAG: hypothetical protein EXS22_09850 [Pedosphaera sp.]|nr:hypothetical protein [Pedosphaera sp.]MSU44317.1 hypothetical protein [Pedosphaera sp.]
MAQEADGADEADEIQIIQREKQKLVMDFRAQTRQPERVTIEVLREMVQREPAKMSLAARHWLGKGGGK